jgi:release factor glutamine methyltransferase
METPFISPDADFEHIYEPAEDSFLLLDALEADLANISAQQPLICVEIGPGSGVVVTALAKVLGSAAHCIGVDINPHACRTTKSTAVTNKTHVDTVNSNLLSNFRRRSIDILVFNPPYVATTDETDSQEFTNTCSNLIRTWAGGQNGRKFIDPLLHDLDAILTPTGVFYLLIEKVNNLAEITEILRAQYFSVLVFKERKIRGEHLFILKIFRNNSK